MAARELSRAGKKIMVLEARDRIGGRIYPLSKEEWGYEAQAGAEFVHGNAPLTKSLAAEAGLTLTNPTEWWSVRDGKPIQIEHISPHDPALEEKLKALTTDMTVAEFLDTYFKDEKWEALRDFVCRWVDGYSAADIDKASIFTFREETLNEGSWIQMNIKEGYGPLVRMLRSNAEERGAQFIFNKMVRRIDISGEGVMVECDDGTNYRAPQAIVSVPLPLLSQITFTPAVPALNATKDIGFGSVIKVLLRFKSRWWVKKDEIFERMFFLVSREEVPTWWTQYPEERWVLSGWIPNNTAKEMSVKSDADIVENSLRSLANIFSVDIETIRQELVGHNVGNWPKDKFTQGAYTYATPQSAKAVEMLRQPIANKLYLAGEALSLDAASLVEGALQSGKEAAEKILGK